MVLYTESVWCSAYLQKQQQLEFSFFQPDHFADNADRWLTVLLLRNLWSIHWSAPISDSYELLWSNFADQWHDSFLRRALQWPACCVLPIIRSVLTGQKLGILTHLPLSYDWHSMYRTLPVQVMRGKFTTAGWGVTSGASTVSPLPLANYYRRW